MHCALLVLTLCAALRDRPVVSLAAGHAAAMFADGAVTRRAVLHGRYEIDPLSRAFIGKQPTWGRMVPVGAGVVIVQTILAERMKQSHNRILRRVWWVPQVVSISTHAALAVRN